MLFLKARGQGSSEEKGFITACAFKMMHLKRMLPSGCFHDQNYALWQKKSETFGKIILPGENFKGLCLFCTCSLSTVSMTIGSPLSHGVAWELSSSQFHWRRDGLDEGCTLGYNDFNNLVLPGR
jgi:hypothetical protein